MQALPVAPGERITALDAVRGVAVLGILTMNAVSYGLSPAAYINLDAGGSDTWLDWLIGGAGEVLSYDFPMRLPPLLERRASERGLTITERVSEMARRPRDRRALEVLSRVCRHGRR